MVVPRLTKKVFVDLKIWMALLGLLVGLAFPVFVLPLGVARDVAIRPVFFAASTAAGLALVAATHRLAQIVVGGQLRRLADRMAFASEQIEEAALSGDASSCTPEACRLEVDSADGFGYAAASFNSLLDSVFAAKQTEATSSGFSALLAQSLDVDDLAESVLRFLVGHTSASAGAFVCFDEGERSVAASHRITGVDELLVSSSAIREAERCSSIQVIDAPADLVIDGGLVSVTPRQVVLIPVVYKGVVIAVVALALTTAVPSEVLRALDLLREPLSVALDNARAHERLQRMAALDPLTGAYNRRFGEQRLFEEFARAVRSGQSLGLLSLDVDHFKRINDTYGHLAGDRVLKQLTDVIVQNSRHGDIVVRTGGEEFQILLPGAGLVDVLGIGERLRQLVRSMAIDVGDHTLEITASFGGIAFPECDVTSHQQLVELSDQALYQSKRAGRDKLTLASAR